MFDLDLGLAYLAGYFDGEGSIFIKVQVRRTRNKPNHELVCSVTSTNKLICEDFMATFNGHITSWDGSKGNKKLWGWKVCSNQALSFLQDVLPLLRQKKAEAEVAISYQIYIRELSLVEREHFRLLLHSLKGNHRVLKEYVEGASL